MPRPIHARIDLSALRHNYLLAKKLISPGQARNNDSRAWAVIKANAYGHGLLRVASALEKIADGFAVLDAGDAVMLRKAGFDHPIILLEGFFDAVDLELCAEYRLIPAVHRVDQLRMIREAALPIRLPIYLKLNTGMNRLGITIDEVPLLRQELASCSAIGDITLMMHFADADGERGIEWQLKCFEAIREAWPESQKFPISMANSAATLRYPATRYDWFRPGIMLYGCSPFDNVSAESQGLKPVMTLASRVIAVHEIGVGERVGYGGLFVAERPTRFGVVACGYADGYPRHAPTGTPILVDGQRTRTLGRVSMDMLACDLTDLPNAGVDSEVVLWGAGMPADEVAAAAGTISYELLCALAVRVPIIEV